MLIRRHTRARGFTLVEMLVVIGIIGVLVGLLLPAVMSGINSARRAQIALEIAQLDQALQAYKNKFGDFPPSLRGETGYNNFLRHVRKCYPNIDSGHLSLVSDAIWPNRKAMTPEYDTVRLDEGEALTFWLSRVDNDPRQPFKALLGFTLSSRIVLFEFDERRLVWDSADDADDDGTVKYNSAGDTVDVDYPSYRAPYSRDTCYIHIDARSYSYYGNNSDSKYAAKAESGSLGYTRPYAATATSTSVTFVNPTTFQIICAGQDGAFGDDLPYNAMNVGVNYKVFPNGTRYYEDDKDNMTNFSEGRRLSDAMP